MKELMYDIDYPSIRETVQNCIGELQAKDNSSYLSGISTGFRPIDYLTSGFENGKVYVIGGRPCMGKEELILSMILDIAVGRGVPVLMFSTNHMKTAYVQRLIGIHSDIPITHLSQGSQPIISLCLRSRRALSRIPGAIEKASKTAIKASLRAGKKQFPRLFPVCGPASSFEWMIGLPFSLIHRRS